MTLNPPQAKAVSHHTGPCLVLAGPGSGKTAVITKRTEYLITQCAVSPFQILVVTFTKAAAGEMRRRFEKNTKGRFPGVTFGTFHAVFFAILKHAYHYRADNIAREEVKYQFLREIIARNHIQCEDEAEFSTQILSEVSALKNSGAALENYYPAHCGKEAFQTIYREYARYMQENRLIDFDDILVYTKELLEQRPDIRAAWQQKFAYIMVDEFQDINQLQYQTVRLLSGSAQNLFVVGDDDQSIYRFRGSNPQLMLNFPNDYPKAAQIQLSVNYRCPKEVVERAGKLIGHNQKRFEKQIKSSQEKSSHPAAYPPFVCRQFDNIQQENQAIAEFIRAYISQGKSLGQVAVLYRTNTQPGALIGKLMEYNIPFHTKEQIPNLYSHWIAKDLMAYFRLALGSRERKEFLRIINRPKRYISRESLQRQTVDFDGWMEFYKAQPWIAERIEQIKYDLQVISRVTPFAAVNYIRKGVGYDGYLEEYAEYRQLPLGELQETLEELQESTKGYRHLDEWLDFTESFTKQLKQKQAACQQQPDTDSVSIMTLHASKGLEYDIVFLPDVNEGLIPYKKAVLPEEMEEERRMLYVGMTRAKKALYISHVKMLRSKKVAPSMFLSEILEYTHER